MIDSQSITIRSLDPKADLAAWTALHNQLPVASGTLRIPYTPESEWARRFEQRNEGRALIVELDGEIVGGGAFWIGQGRRRYTGAFGMSVDSRYHGQGIGSTLLAAIVDLADNWYNLRRLELEVHADNPAGIALYEKFGFEIEGIYRNYSYRNGEFVDALAMARLRRDPWISPSERGDEDE
jgi:putative acetyltransferase